MSQNIEEWQKFRVRVRQLVNEAGGELTGSALGSFVKAQFRLEDLGVVRLQEAFQQLAGEDEFEVLGIGTPRLTIRTGDKKGTPFVEAPKRPFELSRRLTPSAFQAFTTQAPYRYKRYLDTANGAFLDLPETTPSDFQHVLVEPWPQEQQLAFARTFLGEKGLLDLPEFSRALSERSWWGSVVRELQKRDASLLKEYRDSRSTLLFSYVEKWVKSNNVVESLVFHGAATVPARVQPARGSGGEAHSGSRSARDSVLAMLEQMPTEELLKIEIPASVALKVLRPELLDPHN